MKRLLAVLALVLIILIPSFAATQRRAESAMETYIGISTGYDPNVVFSENTEIEHLMPVKIDALIGVGNIFAFNAALGMDIYFPSSRTSGTQVGFVADILAYYRLRLNERISLLLGGGISYKVRSWSTSDRGYNTSHSYNALSVLGSVRLQGDFTDHFSAFASANLGYNVIDNFASRNTVAGNITSESRIAMPFSVNAGLSYKF